jgi:multisite-specific tRNA:(cytosine-C5)-methyltransferase
MFPSGNGSKDICIVRSSSLEMNTDVVDANMKDSPDIGGEQETKVSSDGGNNNENPNTEARTEIDCDSGEATNSSKKLKVYFHPYRPFRVPSALLHENSST